MKRLAFLALLGAACATVETAPAQPVPAPPPSYAGWLGLAAYPSRGQPWEAQRWDDYECWTWAQQNTGIDPTAPPPPPPESDGSAVAMGAAVGALSGAFLGGFWQNPWAGMAAGAMAGAAGGAVADEQRRAQAAAQAQGARLDQFRRAYAACMEGRGYTVR